MFLIFLGAAYALRRRPILLHVFADTGCACGDYHEEVTGIIVRNPFRDASPEKAAAKFLEELRDGRCLADSSLCQYALPDHCISDWRLANRRETRSGIQLFYKLTKYRKSDAKWRLTGEGLIELVPGRGTWIVANYSSYF